MKRRQVVMADRRRERAAREALVRYVQGAEQRPPGATGPKGGPMRHSDGGGPAK